jgi:mannose-6-phosphate isomerase-like protein (cupin superfamily)
MFGCAAAPILRAIGGRSIRRKLEGNAMSYPLEKRELIAEAPGLRMQILTLAAGQEVPWHWHSEVTDTFWCMDGPMVIEMRAPREEVELTPGQMHAVPAKRAHRVTGKDGGRCRFAILQGIGTYDFQPVGGA